MDGGVLQYIRRPHEGGRLALQALRGDALNFGLLSKLFGSYPKPPGRGFTPAQYAALRRWNRRRMRELPRTARGITSERFIMVIGAGSKKRRVVMGPDGKLRLEQFGE